MAPGTGRPPGGETSVPGEPVYGLDGALRLIREFMLRPERGGLPCSRDVPVLVFAGPPGSGRTLLLDELTRRLNRRVPYARVDFRGADDTADSDLPAALAFRLSLWCGKYGSLAFPCLATGQLAMSQDVRNLPAPAARAGVRAVLERYRRIDQLEKFLGEIARDVIASDPHTRDVPGAATAAQYLSKLLVGALTRLRRLRRFALGRGLAWWGRQDLPGDALDVLVQLSNLRHDAAAKLAEAEHKARESERVATQRRVPESRLRAAELRAEADRLREAAAGLLLQVTRLAWAAFLTDLHAGFRKGRHAYEWSFNTVIVADNIDSRAGRAFLDELITACRKHATLPGAEPIPLTVVATSNGQLVADESVNGETVRAVNAGSYDDFRRHADEHTKDGQPHLGRWWYLLQLDDLTRSQVGDLATALRLPAPLSAAETVYRFTRGHPGSTALLLEAIKLHPDGQPGLRAMLSDEKPLQVQERSGSVEELLVGQFLSRMRKNVLADLVTCAAARNITHASRLVDSGLLTAVPPEQAIGAQEAWVQPLGKDRRPAAMHPVLRALLLRRLAARAEPAVGVLGTAPAWSVVFDWLRKNCEDDSADALYYALALGDIKSVSAGLAGPLRQLDVIAWLALLRAVTSAPNRLMLPDASQDPVSGLTSWCDPEDRPAAPLARLVAAHWIAADPLLDTDLSALHDHIADAFTKLAGISSDPHILFEKARLHRASADDALRLRITGGTG